MKHAFSLPFSISAMLSGTAMAAEIARPYTAPVSNTGSLLQITFSLLLVLAVIVAVAWLLKRMNIAQQGTGNLLRVIGSIAIGQRERVVLVEVKDTWLVLGVGPGQIRTLHTLEKPESYQPDSHTNTGSDNKFATLLTTMLKPRAANGKSDAA
ncbi:MAG: flagellar biosynthetic protein FliO [Proteobacteria bacterium]|nr:flagellar biosynthetic protein FliO [Pseudomonadota bacterium]